MNWKLLIFFIVSLFAILYLVIFWENRCERVKFHFFNQKMNISLGLLLFMVFLDTSIIVALLIWLLDVF